MWIDWKKGQVIAGEDPADVLKHLKKPRATVIDGKIAADVIWKLPPFAAASQIAEVRGTDLVFLEEKMVETLTVPYDQIPPSGQQLRIRARSNVGVGLWSDPVTITRAQPQAQPAQPAPAAPPAPTPAPQAQTPPVITPQMPTAASASWREEFLKIILAVECLALIGLGILCGACLLLLCFGELRERSPNLMPAPLPPAASNEGVTDGKAGIADHGPHAASSPSPFSETGLGANMMDAPLNMPAKSPGASARTVFIIPPGKTANCTFKAGYIIEPPYYDRDCGYMQGLLNGKPWRQVGPDDEITSYWIYNPIGDAVTVAVTVEYPGSPNGH